MKKKKEQEREENPLNNVDNSLQINKGVELMLRNRKKEDLSKLFQFKFRKMISIFRRELHFSLDIQFDIRKKES